MKKLPDFSCDLTRRKKGFALVLALSLMSLVFLLVVSLVSLVSTDLNLSELRKQKVIAQANARLGMMVALGEIQKHLGPDTRVTATADILDERVESGSAYLTQGYEDSLSVSEGIDLNEDNQYNKISFGQRYWTGVWKNRAKSKGGVQPGARPFPNILETGNSVNKTIMPDSEYDPHPAVEVAWLVSGNEGYEKKLAVLMGSGSFASRKDYIEIPDAIEKDQRYFNGSQSSYGQEENAWEDYFQVVRTTFSNLGSDEYKPNYYHPLVDLPDPDDSQFPNQTVWILKKPLLKSSYDPKNPRDWKNHLAGEPVKVRKTKFELPDEGDGLGSNAGSYAYWVGDEGVKTKANLVDQNKGENVWDDLSIAKEPNLEAGFGITFAQSIEKERQNILSLGMFTEIDEVSGDTTTKSNSIAAHFHSLTTDSYGVLSDVRTGGLKRDLSAAFAVDSESTWEKDFKGYLYQDRVYYMKNLSFRSNAFANQWNDQSSGQFSPSIDDKNFVLAGPRWSTLKAFHNMWEELESSGSLPDDEILPDGFPRIVGDNNVIYPFQFPPNRPNGEMGVKNIEDRINLFKEPTMRPEPKNHPVVPSFVEFKFSAVPTWTSDNKLALAMYPSVAFWNPYNVPLAMKDIFIEVPMNVDTAAYNSREWDLFKKWYIHNPNGTASYIPDHLSTSNTTMPAQNWQVPPGSRPYIDTNGNGRWDPGEPRTYIPRPPPKRPGGGGGGGPNLGDNHFSFRRTWMFDHAFNLRDIRHPQGSNFGTFRNDTRYTGFPPDFPPWGNNGLVPRYHFFRSLKQDSSNLTSTRLTSERHLLLKISNLQLDAGEKAHFVVSQDQTWEWVGLSNSNNVQYIEASLSKGDEGFPYALICKTGFTMTPSEPLTMHFRIHSIRGVNRVVKEDFDLRTGERVQSSSYFRPQGITVYGNDPRSNSLTNLKIIKKVTKEFPLEVGSGHLDFSQASLLANNINAHSSAFLIGNGFRLRWEFPGTANSVVFNQYNPRALVDSLQEGYGNNWKTETFNSTHYRGKGRFHGTYNKNNFSFYSPPLRGDDLDPAIDFTTVSSASAGFETEISLDAIVPKASISNSTGFFHEQMSMGSSMTSSNSAVMFDLPRSPLLSLGQLKHANLNNYSHGPSYIVGNSYSSPQVGRYKTWARVRALKAQPKGSMDIVGQKAKFNFFTDIPGVGNTYITLFPWLNNWNNEYGAIRDDDAQNEHQNITLDHSYYANRALFDGYFFSGLDDLNTFTSIPTDLAPGDRLSPFRNSRLVPFLREEWIEAGRWKLTEYDQEDIVKVGSSQNIDLRYQTLAADILVDGAFNINSTSVDAWVSQLTALKGYRVPGASSPTSETPFPRFLNKMDENSWNKLCSLDDNEIMDLAKSLVKQIKLRGPFLSFSDFVNRRIQSEAKDSLIFLPFTEWPEETRNSTIGLRGTVQAAIADAEINQGGFKFRLAKQPMGNPVIPKVPETRFQSNLYVNNPFTNSNYFSNSNFQASDFGLHAIIGTQYANPITGSKMKRVAFSQPATPSPSVSNPIWPADYITYPQPWGMGVEDRENVQPPFGRPGYVTPATDPSEGRVEYKMYYYENAFSNGEAPDNLLAVENVATAANKPGWLMQADVLSPLVPVTSARSDTFVIRVMGETPATEDQPFSSRAWIELTVQRTPDYVKSDLDAPHHRPHEPFEDLNFDGIWNGRDEHWLDLNQNSRDKDGNDVTNGIEAGPDLPGIGKTGATSLFADGLKTDLKLNPDKMEETLSNPDKDISYQGINQRFGRKFRIVKFRWLNENDV
jgi:hypothetical protein